MEGDKYESSSTLLRNYLRDAKMSEAEFGRRLEQGDPAAAIIYAASRLDAAISLIQTGPAE